MRYPCGPGDRCGCPYGGRGRSSGEDPAYAIIAHLTLRSQDFAEFRGDRLRALPSLAVRNEQAAIVEVDLVEARRQNLGVTHRRVQAEGDKQPTKWVGALEAGAHQRNTLVVTQRNDTAGAFLQHPKAARTPVEPFPVNCHRKQVGERRQLAIDGAVGCLGMDTLLLISIHSIASSRISAKNGFKCMRSCRLLIAMFLPAPSCMAQKKGRPPATRSRWCV